MLLFFIINKKIIISLQTLDIKPEKYLSRTGNLFIMNMFVTGIHLLGFGIVGAFLLQFLSSPTYSHHKQNKKRYSMHQLNANFKMTESKMHQT